MKIGELAGATGLTTKTIRFYEQEGLLPEPPRTETGYRIYERRDIERLSFVRKAKLLGLSLDQIRGALVLNDRSEPTCIHVRDLLDDKIDDLDQAIKDLRAFRKELSGLRDKAGTMLDCHPTMGNVCGIITGSDVHVHGDALAWIEGASSAVGRRGSRRGVGRVAEGPKQAGKRRGDVVVEAKSRVTSYGVEELAAAFRELEIPPRSTPEQSKLLIAIWRRLAEGVAIPADEVEEIAGGLGFSKQAAWDFLQWMSERDGEGSMTGVLGLTLNDMFPSKLTHKGVELTTYCAWDSLFLPMMLGGESTVEAPSAGSGEMVSMRVTPDGVSEVSPSSAYVSFVVPERDARDSVETVVDVWGVFCHHVLFFASRDEAEVWADSRDGAPVALLSVEEAFRLAKIAFADIAQYA